MNIPLMFLMDGYKLDHRRQYPDNTSYVYSNLTPRSSRVEGQDRVVFFGLQYFLKRYFNELAYETFFDRPLDKVVTEYQNMLDSYLGPNEIGTDHIAALHKLGYLPLEVYSIAEGTPVPLRMPFFTIENTHPDFFWLTNYFETLISSVMWLPCTTATTAWRYRQLMNKHSNQQGCEGDFVAFQGHDFSFRGMGSPEAAALSGAAHLLSFTGTDAVPAIDLINRYYGNSTGEMLAGTVPACYSEDTEILTQRGFIPFPDLCEDDKVAQYHEDGSISFVLPDAYYADDYNGPMAHIYSDTDLRYYDVVVTPNHKMVRIDPQDNISLMEAGLDGDMMPFHTNHRLAVAGQASGNISELSFEDKLRIAFQADGSFSNRSEQYTGGRTGCTPIRFSLKKDRKIERLEKIVTELGYEYSTAHYENGYCSLRINVPNNLLISKTFDWIDLSDKNFQWAREFIDELAQWDGSRPREELVSYSSVERFNVEQVQAICAIAGCKSQFSKYTDARGDRKPLYSVIISDKITVSVGRNSTRSIEECIGTVYCVSVPTKMIIIKHNDRVLVCGNTEHSVMSAGGQETELQTYERLLDLYPGGIVSIVSDTWDFWNVLTNIVPTLKNRIMARDGKLTVRPDSGDPVKIICGDPEMPAGTPEYKGAVECLWETFGGTSTKEGYKVLDSHIGLIYGDAITYERCREICERLQARGFAMANVIFGIGSYTYQYVTRDTYGMAMKATYAEVNGKGLQIFKDPKSDDGVKKSARGRICLNYDESSQLVMTDGLDFDPWAEMVMRNNSAYRLVWGDGMFSEIQSFDEIRKELLSAT